MTTLDKQALEKAYAAFSAAMGRPSEGPIRPVEECISAAITAYLAALPEARRYWAWYSSENREHDPQYGCFYVLEAAARAGADSDDFVKQVEIREVRQP